MAKVHRDSDPPMPRPGDAAGKSFLRRTRDQDEVQSVISHARSMLSDTHIMANNATQVNDIR